MHFTTSTWQQFQDAFDGPHNFLMRGQCVPFAFDFPPIEQVVDELRRDEEVNIHSGVKDKSLVMDNILESFRKLPIEEAVKSSFGMAHYRLGKFDAPGRFLHGFKERVLDPWENALKAAGFTWDRCYPIVFISGPGCATNYHMDFSNVMAWQIYGVKRFCGLKQPGRWAPHRARIDYSPNKFARPPELTDDDALCYEMRPGDVLWNILLTPHWVEASQGIAMSVNLSHGGLRLNGRLCPTERDLFDHRAAIGNENHGKVGGRY